MSEISDLKEIYLLSEYRIDENDSEMKSIIENFYKYHDNKEYYQALYTLESLILQDGTSQKYNYIFLKFIISNIVNLIEDINKKKLEKMKITKKKDKKLTISDYLNDVDKYDFYYLRNCFDKYEIALSDNELNEILKEKIKYNEMIIENEDKELRKKYSKFIKRFNFEGNFILPNEIYETINDFNKLIKNKDYKLFYLYKYIKIENIEKDYIFEYLEKDYLYLNQFYFSKFDDLGIPIGYSNNIHIIYRYLFSIIKNKINVLENDKNEEDYEKGFQYIFNTFKTIFQNIQKNKIIFMKYFSFIFSNVIFDVDRNILFAYQFNEIPTYFRNLINQFLYKDEIDKNILKQFKKKKMVNISFRDEGNATISINNEIIELNNKEFSINSFLYNYVQNFWLEHVDIIKNKSQRLLCKNKIYGKYFNEFINLLKKICLSNVAKTLQSLHEEFKQYKPFYENDGILEDLFNNRLKFYPFERKSFYGHTDKYLMEIYLSSIYSLNTSTSLNQYCKKHPHILIIFNMGFNSVIFQHESLNHYIRAYLSYSNDQNNNLRKINMNTKKNYCYYPKQKLNKIKNVPLYLKKFFVKMNSTELKELKKVSTLNFQDLLEESSDEKNDGDDSDVEMSDDNNDINTNYIKNESNNVYNIIHSSDDDDEGYYYERQLFTSENENKLKEFNFLQALMLLDEDAYNLDPVHFHYCFLKLKNANNYKLIKENFQSPLLKLLLEKVDFSKSDEIKKLTFISKRSSTGGLLFEFNREACDVMPPYIRNVNQ